MDHASAMPDAASYREHIKALDTIRAWKTFFVVLAILALATHVGGWALVQLGDGLSGGGETETTQVNGNQEPSRGTSVEQAERYEAWLERVLPLAEFIGRSTVPLLGVAMLLAVLVSLSGRLGGASDFIAALFVTIFLGALFLPWERLSELFAERDTLSFATFTSLERLRSHYEANEDLSFEGTDAGLLGKLGMSPHRAAVTEDAFRFAGLPFLAILLLFYIGSRFKRGYRMARSRNAGEIPMKVV